MRTISASYRAPRPIIAFALASGVTAMLGVFGCSESNEKPPFQTPPDSVAVIDPAGRQHRAELPRAPKSALLGESAPSEELDIVGQRHWLLPPGTCAEVDFEMSKGDDLTAEFQADGNLWLDAHTHIGFEVKVYGRTQGQAGAIDFTAPMDGVFSFLWAHAGPPDQSIDIKVELRGKATIVGWIP